LYTFIIFVLLYLLPLLNFTFFCIRQELFPELSDLFSTPLKTIQLYYNDHKDELLIRNPLLTDEEAKKLLSKRFSMDFEKRAMYKEKYEISKMEQQRKLEQLS